MGGRPALIEKFRTIFPHLREGIDYLRNQLLTNKSGLDRDNQLIYFQTVPSHDELPVLPQGAFIMNRKVFEPPQDETIHMFNRTDPVVASKVVESENKIETTSSNNTIFKNPFDKI